VPRAHSSANNDKLDRNIFYRPTGAGALLRCSGPIEPLKIPSVEWPQIESTRPCPWRDIWNEPRWFINQPL